MYVRRPTGDTSWVMRIQNQVQYDMPNSEFPLHDITSVFFPSHQLGQYSSMLETPSTNTNNAEIIEEQTKSNEPSSVIIPSEQKQIFPKLPVSSGPIQIPGSPLRQLSNSSEERDQDIAFDEGDDRSRNPVRRVNSSPEMSSSYKKPYLNRDKSDNSTSSQDSNCDDDVIIKKNSKCFTKERGCEAIPEEMSGGTPPSHPALMTLHSDPGKARFEFYNNSIEICFKLFCVIVYSMLQYLALMQIN